MRLCLLAALLPLAAQPGAFRDGFETETGWFLFEEVVGGNQCYGEGIGTMTATPERAWAGGRSLRLWANEKRTPKANHLIAVKRLDNRGRGGRWTYTAHAFVPPSARGYQTGPEISIQNTRKAGTGAFLTHTAAVQFHANQNRTRSWMVWAKNAQGEAGWLPAFDFDIEQGKWYRLSLEADFDGNRYGWLTIEGPDGARHFDLSGYEMAAQKKHEEEALAITLEAENLWNECGRTGVSEQRVYYDDVSFVPTPRPAVVAAHPSAGGETRQKFRFEFEAASADRPVAVANVLINRTLDPAGGCYLAYSAAAGLLHLMDESGTKTLASLRAGSTGAAAGRRCEVNAVRARTEGTRLVLDLDLTFHPTDFAGEHTIYLAARDGRGGNSGWVASGRWRVGAR